MTCSRCGKRLSRKSARTLDGVAPLCAPCMFDQPAKAALDTIADNIEAALGKDYRPYQSRLAAPVDSPRMAETEGLGAKPD